jgi:hypothetical protein
MTRLKTNLKFIVIGEVIDRDESLIVVTRVGVVIVPWVSDPPCFEGCVVIII